MQLQMALAEPREQGECAETGDGRPSSVERMYATDWAKFLRDSLSETRGMVPDMGIPYPTPDHGYSRVSVAASSGGEGGGRYGDGPRGQTKGLAPGRKDAPHPDSIHADARGPPPVSDSTSIGARGGGGGGCMGPPPTGYTGHTLGGDADDGRREMKAMLRPKAVQVPNFPSTTQLPQWKAALARSLVAASVAMPVDKAEIAWFNEVEHRTFEELADSGHPRLHHLDALLAAW